MICSRVEKRWIVVLIVNNDLQIRRFTPFAQELFKIKPSDVGRSITDFHLGLSAEELEKAIRSVTTKFVAATQEVSGGKVVFMKCVFNPT